MLDDTGNIPPNVLLQYFRLLKPTQELAQYANLLDNLWDDKLVESHQRMTGWAKDHVPFPGRAAKQTVDVLMRDNGFITDRLVLGGRTRATSRTSARPSSTSWPSATTSSLPARRALPAARGIAGQAGAASWTPATSVRSSDAPPTR